MSKIEIYRQLTPHLGRREWGHNFCDAPYALSDITPAAAGTKALMLENAATNCIGLRTSAETEALFDNVAINQ